MPAPLARLPDRLMRPIYPAAVAVRVGVEMALHSEVRQLHYRSGRPGQLRGEPPVAGFLRPPWESPRLQRWRHVAADAIPIPQLVAGCPLHPAHIVETSGRSTIVICPALVGSYITSHVRCPSLGLTFGGHYDGNGLAWLMRVLKNVAGCSLEPSRLAAGSLRLWAMKELCILPWMRDYYGPLRPCAPPR